MRPNSNASGVCAFWRSACLEQPGKFVRRGDHRLASERSRKRPGLSLGHCGLAELDGQPASVIIAPEPQVCLHHLCRRPEVHVADRRGLREFALLLEVCERLGWASQRQLEFSERGQRPERVQSGTQLARECQGFSGVGAALGFATLPRLQPREPGQGEDQARSLVAFA